MDALSRVFLPTLWACCRLIPRGNARGCGLECMHAPSPKPSKLAMARQSDRAPAGEDHLVRHFVPFAGVFFCRPPGHFSLQVLVQASRYRLMDSQQLQESLGHRDERTGPAPIATCIVGSHPAATSRCDTVQGSLCVTPIRPTCSCALACDACLQTMYVLVDTQASDHKNQLVKRT